MAGVSAAFFFGGSGCAGRKPPPPYIDTSIDFTGPAIELGEDRTVVATVPSGGWSFVLDQTIRGRYGVSASATLMRPEPGSMNTAMMQELPLSIPGAEGLPVAVYIRLVEEGQKNAKAEPYRLAATTSPRP